MNASDLELYRWKWHNDVFVPCLNPTSVQYYGWTGYWKEHGAFVSASPRQIGKTTMLSQIINVFDEKCEKYLIVFPSSLMLMTARNNFGFSNAVTADNLVTGGVKGYHHNEIHLMIDEFDHIDNGVTNIILSHAWKSVTMVGTLK